MEPASPSPYTPHPGHSSFRRKSDPPEDDVAVYRGGRGRRGSMGGGKGDIGGRARRRVSIKALFEDNQHHLEMAGVAGCPETGGERRDIITSAIERIEAGKTP